MVTQGVLPLHRASMRYCIYPEAQLLRDKICVLQLYFPQTSYEFVRRISVCRRGIVCQGAWGLGYSEKVCIYWEFHQGHPNSTQKRFMGIIVLLYASNFIYRCFSVEFHMVPTEHKCMVCCMYGATVLSPFKVYNIIYNQYRTNIIWEYYYLKKIVV